MQINELKNSLVQAEKDHQESIARQNRQMKEKEELVKKKAEEIKGLRKVFDLTNFILEWLLFKKHKRSHAGETNLLRLEEKRALEAENVRLKYDSQLKNIKSIKAMTICTLST